MENIIDLNTPTRELSGNSKTSPICLGLQGDMESYTVPFKFTNANIVNGCKCFVQFINADLDEGIQQINNKYSTSIGSNGIVDEQKISENDNTLVVDWRPSFELLKADGLVKFSFQFYILEDDSTYSFILNTSPIYGYVHNGLAIEQEDIVSQYPTEIADLYDKYDKLLKNNDAIDLNSFEEIIGYLNAKVPSEDNLAAVQYLVAYNPETKLYSYTPAIKLNDQVIIGNIWNAE